MYKIKIIIVTFFSLSLQNCSTKKDNSYLTGKWSWIKNSESYQFELNLKASKDKIEGSHCGIAEEGEKIDCAEDDEQSILGNIINSKIDVQFESLYSGEKGKATINIISSDTLEWRIYEAPSGEYYIPKRALLVKQ